MAAAGRSELEFRVKCAGLKDFYCLLDILGRRVRLLVITRRSSELPGHIAAHARARIDHDRREGPRSVFVCWLHRAGIVLQVFGQRSGVQLNLRNIAISRVLKQFFEPQLQVLEIELWRHYFFSVARAPIARSLDNKKLFYQWLDEKPIAAGSACHIFAWASP
jgi:hypothetical protein